MCPYPGRPERDLPRDETTKAAARSRCQTTRPSRRRMPDCLPEGAALNATYFTLPAGGSDAVAAGEGCEKPGLTRDVPSPLVPRDPPGGRVKSKMKSKVSGIGRGPVGRPAWGPEDVDFRKVPARHAKGKRGRECGNSENCHPENRRPGLVASPAGFAPAGPLTCRLPRLPLRTASLIPICARRSASGQGERGAAKPGAGAQLIGQSRGSQSGSSGTLTIGNLNATSGWPAGGGGGRAGSALSPTARRALSAGVSTENGG